ncbi:MAG: phosphotransferase [Nocardioidaceae bacterium]
MSAQPSTATRRQNTTRRAVEAAVHVARSHGIRVDEPIVLNDLFSVVVHLAPAPVVACVPTWISRLRDNVEDAMRREIAVTEFLHAQGAPVVAPSTDLPPGPHRHDGFAVSFWPYVEADPDRTVTAADCAVMLPDLHRALAAYPGDLPTLEAAAVDVTRWLESAETATGSGSASSWLDVLRTAASRLRPLLKATAGTVVVHGDAHPGNMIASRPGLLWIDFEEVSRGPAEWDYATIGDDGALEVLDALDSASAVDPRRLADCRRLRSLQIALCLLALREDFADVDGWDQGIEGFVVSLAEPGRGD